MKKYEKNICLKVLKRYAKDKQLTVLQYRKKVKIKMLINILE